MRPAQSPPMRRRLAVLLLALASCVSPAEVRRAPAERSASVTPDVAPARTTPAAESSIGRWIAVDVVGDDAQTRDIRVGVLEKMLVVNPGGHVILRGVDRAPGGGTASFSGMLVGRVLTLEGIPSAAILAHEGTRLLLTDPAGRQTRFIRAAD